MKNQKKLSSILTVLFAIVFIGISASCSTGCSNIFDPLATKAQAKSILNKSLTIDYKFISQENISQNKRVFNFEDANGVAFCVTSEVYEVFPFPVASESCNYAAELAKPAVQELEVSALYRHSNNVYVENYADLAPTAEFVLKTLSMIEPFPIKRDAFNWSGLPRIYVRIPNESENNALYEIASFEFICEGEELPTVEQIFTKLEGKFIYATKNSPQ